jgi:hypothetical protein
MLDLDEVWIHQVRWNLTLILSKIGGESRNGNTEMKQEKFLAPMARTTTAIS